jgi:hypothetical protein
MQVVLNSQMQMQILLISSLNRWTILMLLSDMVPLLIMKQSGQAAYVHLYIVHTEETF